MRIDVITLFPELFAPFLSQGVTRRAFVAEVIDVHLHQLRDFAAGQYRRVDDRPYGGGPGMVMLPQPLQHCVEHIRSQRNEAAEGVKAPVILFSPTGKTLTHQMVSELASSDAGAVLLCGRYEGVDQRFIDRYVDLEISLGDFVLSGGEIPAMALLDAIARLQPGVLGDHLSSEQDSFNPAVDGLLDYPHFTRPEKLGWDMAEEGLDEVPPVLLSGDHQAIAKWRREQQLHLTACRRPDLIMKAIENKRLSKDDKDFLQENGYNFEF